MAAVRTIFVYGTLKPSLAPAVVKSAVDTFQPLGPATVRGVLYDLGRYPGVVLTPDDPANTVHGDLFALPEDAATLESVLRRLDRYEGYDPARPESSAFVRTTTAALTPAGTETPALIYVYTRPVKVDQRIAAGRWEPV
ncbi:MAG: gamma-glutamylcyclotransferase family protein [Tepidisphaeraceae bacterium]